MSAAYTWSDVISSLRYLQAEGYIELFFDENGQECVRICEGSEDAEV
jgi:hypothetical protein